MDNGGSNQINSGSSNIKRVESIMFTGINFDDYDSILSIDPKISTLIGSFADRIYFLDEGKKDNVVSFSSTTAEDLRREINHYLTSNLIKEVA